MISLTELLVLRASHRPHPQLDNLLVGDEYVTPSRSARNIGVVFDDTMSMESQIMAICKSCFYHIKCISRIRRYLSFEDTKKLVHAFIISRIDHCNSLLYGLPNNLIDRLQYVLNSAARLITMTRKFDHITQSLIDLHWLPVRQRIEFKIALITYKALNSLAPCYIRNLISPYVPTRSLRSSSKNLLQVINYNLKRYGYRAFSVCAPLIWNSLPINVRHSPSFKKELKTHLFRLAY